MNRRIQVIGAGYMRKNVSANLDKKFKQVNFNPLSYRENCPG